MIFCFFFTFFLQYVFCTTSAVTRSRRISLVFMFNSPCVLQYSRSRLESRPKACCFLNALFLFHQYRRLCFRSISSVHSCAVVCTHISYNVTRVTTFFVNSVKKMENLNFWKLTNMITKFSVRDKKISRR